MDKNKKNIRKNTEESEAAKPQNTEKEPETKAGETVSNGDDKEENCELEDCKKQIEELKDKYLRQAAEFDNYRKRIIREKTELIQNGGENVINSLLPVIDDFERAIKNNEKAEDIETLKTTGRFVKISAASLKESHPHDIHITKEAPNYSVDE